MPQRLSKSSHRSLKWPLLVVFLLWFLALGLLAANRQPLLDWLKLRNYHAPVAIAALATDDTMTPAARRVFYVNAPKLEPKSTFNNFCSNNSEQTVVLGCYVGDQNGIYLLTVSDPRLQGIEQVTAAHEMLHAEYDRLSSVQRTQVDGWLMDYYNHGLQDPVVKAQIASYQKTEPHDVVNEMHSVFGTEIANLPTNLENYYKRYFTSRATVTNFATQYEAEFSSRQNQISADDAQLATLKAEINDDESDAKTRQTQLNNQQAQLDSEQNSGNTTAYNNGVASYNVGVAAYNNEVDTIHGLVNQYNALVDARNQIALEEQQLSSDITSKVSPVTK